MSSIRLARCVTRRGRILCCCSEAALYLAGGASWSIVSRGYCEIYASSQPSGDTMAVRLVRHAHHLMSGTKQASQRAVLPHEGNPKCLMARGHSRIQKAAPKQGPSQAGRPLSRTAKRARLGATPEFNTSPGLRCIRPLDWHAAVQRQARCTWAALPS